MKKLIFLFLFSATIAATSCAQTANEYWKNTTLTYSKIPPTWTPSSTKANELVIDTSTYTWYQWSHTSHGWVSFGRGLDYVSGCSAPLYTPTKLQSPFAVNACDSLYQYRAGAWRHLNAGGGSTYTSGYGIDIAADVISADTTALATVYALSDSAAAIRADFPSGGSQDTIINGIVWFNKSLFTSDSDFINTSVTDSISEGSIVVYGGSGGYSQHLQLTGATIDDDRTEISCTFKFLASASDNGISVGKNSTNGWYLRSIAITLSPLLNSLRIVQTDNSNVVANKVLSFTPASGDIITLKYIQLGGVITGVVINHTQNKTDVVSSADNFTSSSLIYPPNTSRATIWANKGTYAIKSFVVSSPVYRPDYMLIGDSKVFGYNGGAEDLRLVNLLSDKGIISCNAGNGDRTAEVLSSINYIKAFKPKNVILNIGRNDLASGVSSGTWQANYTAIVDSLENNGIRVFHLMPIPETNTSQASLWTWLQANYTTDTIGVSSGWANSTMLSADNIHPTNYGIRHVADKIKSAVYTYQTSKKTDISGMILGEISEGITGTGTANYLPKFTSATVIANSAINDDGTSINSSEPIRITSATSDKIVLSGDAAPVIRFKNTGGSDMAMLQASSGFVRLYTYGAIPVDLVSQNKIGIRVNPLGSLECGNVGGYGYTNAAIFVRGFNDLSTGYSLVCSPATVSTSTAPLTVNNIGKVGMGTNTPAASAKLDVTSTTSGFLPPRMTGTQAEAIASPAEGLMIYSTDGSGSTITSKGWWGYDGSAWVKLN